MDNNDIISPFQQFIITKSWISDGTLYREGWISTNDTDLQKEITEPEAFEPVLDSYFSRGAPLSSTHDTRSYPVGHLQAGALVRDGSVFKSATHPTDPAELTALPPTGTGFYARLAINDPIAASQVAKGNVGGCSFIASVSKAENTATGRRFLEFSNLVETTIAAYPINPQAVLSIAKAYGITGKEIPDMTPEQVTELITKALAAYKPEVPAVPAVTAESLAAALDVQIQKAIDTKLTELTHEREGVGRAGTIQKADTREDNPEQYIIKKAQSGDALDMEDKELIAGLTLAAIFEGMRA